jgi:hypothetical protein
VEYLGMLLVTLPPSLGPDGGTEAD